jgi:hypothetical protein
VTHGSARLWQHNPAPRKWPHFRTGVFEARPGPANQFDLESRPGFMIRYVIE